MTKETFLSDRTKRAVNTTTITMTGAAAVAMASSILTGTPPGHIAVMPVFAALNCYTCYTVFLLVSYILGDAAKRRSLPIAQIGGLNMSAAFVGVIAFQLPDLQFFTVVPPATLGAAGLWVLWFNIQQEKDSSQ